MNIPTILVLFFALTALSSCKKIDPNAHLQDPTLVFLKELQAEQVGRVNDQRTKLKTSEDTLKKALSTQGPIKISRKHVFDQYNLLQKEEQYLQWLEYRIENETLRAKMDYIKFYYTNKDSKADWRDFQRLENFQLALKARHKDLSWKVSSRKMQLESQESN